MEAVTRTEVPATDKVEAVTRTEVPTTDEVEQTRRDEEFTQDMDERIERGGDERENGMEIEDLPVVGNDSRIEHGTTKWRTTLR